MDITRVCDAKGWLDFVRKKPKGELVLILYEREKYASEFVAMVEEVLKTKYGLSEKELHSASLFTTPKLKAKKRCDLLIELLEAMGVRWDNNYLPDSENDEEDDDKINITFDYCDSGFDIQADNYILNIRIVTSFYHDVICSVEDFTRLRKAINELNWKCCGNIVFSIDNRIRCDWFSVEQIVDCVIRPQIPNLMFYLHHTLRSMLETKQEFNKILERLKQDDLSNDKKRPHALKHSSLKEFLISDIITPKTVSKMRQKKTKKTKGTRQLFITSLEQAGCPYSIEDDYIYFFFQGERFRAIVSDDNPYVFVYDDDWFNVDLSDLDEVSRLRRAINEVNWKSAVSLMYDIDATEKKMYLSGKIFFFFSSKIGDLTMYLGEAMHIFFYARHSFGAEMEKLRMAEREEE